MAAYLPCVSINKPERCPYGHSLARGMPQKISWLPCICEPARESESQGRGMGHVTLWCGTCSDQDHRDTRFYEPPHQVDHHRPLSGWATRPDVLAFRHDGRGGAWQDRGTPRGGMGSRGRIGVKPRMGKTRPQREMGYGFGTADLVEADQVESKVLNPVKQVVQVTVVSG